MTEAETKETSPLEKYGVKRVRVKVYENWVESATFFGVLDPSKIEITSEGRIHGTLSEYEDKYSTFSLPKIEETPKGSHSMSFSLRVENGSFIYGKITAAIGQSNLSLPEVEEVQTTIVDKFINPVLAEKGFVLRRDESPPRLNEEGQPMVTRFYHCQP